MPVFILKNGGETLTGSSGNDTITGGTGNDRIISGEGADLIDGGDGDDQINGYPTTGNAYSFWTYSGSKTINGGNGDDFIYGADAADSISGGNGNDTLYGSVGNDSIEGSLGNDFLSGGTGNDSISGGLGNDSLYGGDGSDYEEGGDGDDYFSSQSGGNDTLLGGSGNDDFNAYTGTGNKFIDGESGDDKLYGGSGNDSLIGGTGEDTINGSSGNDSITGGIGNDNLYGDEDNDTVDGGTGNDSLIGGDGEDSLVGGDGNDTISGSAGNDFIQGGAGDETINKVDETGNDTVFGGEGNDYVNFTNVTGNKLIYGESGNDSLDGGTGNDSIYGGIGNDSIDGNLGNDSLFGGEGNDSIYGDLGNDTIDGGAGNDSIYSGSGNDSVSGNDGDDYIQGNDGTDTISGGSGNDTLHKYLASGSSYLDGGIGDDTIWGGTDNDTIIGGDGNDSWLQGYAGNDSISGGSGNDKLTGNEGNDILDGGSGNDYLSAEIGDDYLDGGTGDDTLNGGDGNDSLLGGDGNDRLIDQSDGQDTLFGGDGDDTLNVYTSTGNKYLDGGFGADTLYGGTGSDTLNGGDDNDYIDGNESNDSVLGGAGNDTLNGGVGNDTLDGGTGNDTLYGGGGNDTYFINSTFDYIYDSSGTDTAYVSTSFVKIPSSIENVIYTNDAQALPYWISALLPDEAAGKRFTTLLGDSKTFGYSFPITLPSYETSAKDANGFTPFTVTQQARTVDAFTYIASLLDLQFNKVSDPASKNTFTFASNIQTNSGGYASPPSSSFEGSDIYLNKVDYNDTLADRTYGALVLIHEIGHALGLKHPFDHEQAGEGGIADAPYLTGTEENAIWTVMSYEKTKAQYQIQFSPLDIAALQYLYGPSKTARSGNDVYKISTIEPNFVWDGAGLDAIDAGSVTQAATIYLTPGYQGFIGTTKAEKITTAGQITVNFGSVIENLIGSNYDDRLYGNEVGNKIEGGAGSDSIEGWDGDDTLLGGAGNDYLTGGSGSDSIEGGDGNDTLVVNGITTNYTIRYESTSLSYSIEAKSGSEGKDTFKSIEFLKFSDKTLAIQSLDLTPPTIAISSNLTSLGIGKTATITFTLNKASTTFTASDITVSGGTLTNFTGSGSAYAAIFTAAANSLTNGVISVASGVFTDAAGNLNADGSDSNNTLTMAVDTVSPVITLSSNKTNLIAGESATLTFTLSEASTTFTVSSAKVTGGLLSNFTGSDKSYTATFTPTENSTTNGVIYVPSEVFTDLASNANTDGSETNNIITLAIDTVVPNIILSSSKSSLIAGETATLTFTLSELSTNFAASDVIVSGGTLSNFKGNGATYTALFTPNANSTSIGVISVASSAFTDAAGNSNADGSDTNNKLTLSIDSILPTYSIISEQTSVDEGRTATFKVTTTKIAAGTQLNYFIGGVSSQDISGNLLQGSVFVGTNGVAQILINLSADSQTEGPETLTVTIEGLSASTVINDTSIYKGPAASDLVYVFKSEKVGLGINPASYSYFYTTNTQEAAFIKAQSNWPWVEKLSTFEAAHSNPSLSVPVFRFWSEKFQSHFFTINKDEKDQVIAWSQTGKNGYDWKYEGENFKVYTSSTPTDSLDKSAIPIYRIWMDDKDFNPSNGLSGGHYFTANKTEYDAMIKLTGVVGEGVAFFGEVPGN